MAYSELIKNFGRIRDYMRQFYVYGFKRRTEYDKKSTRSYDNERRRLESWLRDFMRFRQTPDGKNVFLSVDSRSVERNPLHQAFKAKSFTTGDVTFHFYILDLLQPGEACTAQQLLERMFDRYLCRFESDWQPDLSTIRKKLKEYVSIGLLQAEKRGRELYYSRAADTVPLEGWAEAAAFYSEADPLGVIGSTVLDKLAQAPGHYRFKHHHMLHTLDSQILLQLLEAMGERMTVSLANVSPKKEKQVVHTICPLKILIGTQGGRQYLLGFHKELKKLIFFRLDYIQSVAPLEKEPLYDKYIGYWEKLRLNLWGTSTGIGYHMDHLEMTLHFDEDEQYIPARLEREKRCGRVEWVDRNTCRYIADVYDASELLPWIRTFIGRIEKLECTDETVTARFYGDLEQVLALYGGENHAFF